MISTVARVTVAGKSLQVTRTPLGDSIHWKATSEDVITNEDAADAQSACGFDPCGYGFFSFHCVKSKEKGNCCTWESQSNCD